MTRAAIKHAEDRLGRAIVESNLEALDELLSDRVIFCAPDGTVLHKEDDLEAHRSGRQRVSRYEPKELSIELFGATAIVSVRVDLEGTFDGKPFAGALRYTRTWVVEDGKFRVVAAHSSTLSA